MVLSIVEQCEDLSNFCTCNGFDAIILHATTKDTDQPAHLLILFELLSSIHSAAILV